MAAFVRKLLSWILTHSVYLFGTVEGTFCTYYRAHSYFVYNYYYFTYETRYRYTAGYTRHCATSCCYVGCCFDYSDTDSYYSSSAMSSGTIAGIVIGCLVAIAVIISLIVVRCVCMRPNRTHPGQFATTRGQLPTYITSNQQAASGQTGSTSNNTTPPVVVETRLPVNSNWEGTSNVDNKPEIAGPPSETLKQY